jgi:hypothetical protein
MDISRFRSLVLKLILLICVFIAVKRCCYRVTGGFAVSKIIFTHQVENDAAEFTQGPLSDLELSQIAHILDQPFYFYGKGGQCFAFISADGKMVIKFFKQHHMRFWGWLDSVHFPRSFDHYRTKLLYKHRHQSFPYFLHSCKTAYEKFREETGLIYMQFGKTPFVRQDLVIYDNLNIAHTIHLENMAFAIQQKAEPFLPRFKKLIKKKDIEACKRHIDTMLEFIVKRCREGVADRDVNMHTNFGMLDTRMIEIDIGSYHDDASLKDPLVLKAELHRQTDEFQKWLKKRNPELAHYLSKKISSF